MQNQNPTSSSSFLIKFPRTVGGTTFESILKDNYAKCLAEETKKIVFDFTSVSWCGVFELSLLSLWLLELRGLGGDITFRMPSDPTAYQYLKTYSFDTFLGANKIPRENEVSIAVLDAPKDLFRAPYYPLTYFTDKQFITLMSELGHGNRLELVLNDIKDSEIVASGTIRDIVLAELGANLHIHAKWRFANMIMTKYGASSYEHAAKWTRAVLREVTELERPFFERLYGQSFLTLVIADKGEGISNSLRASYLADEILHNRKDLPTERDIIEYAFLYHSTRRTIDERIGDIKSVISEEAVKFPPPTGLHRLKELVREFYGLLYVRSGASILCYDFYNNHSRDEPTFNTDVKSLRNLANFGGTQYKIYFPVKMSKRHFVASSLGVGVSESINPPKYWYLSTKPYSTYSKNPSVGLDIEAEHLFRLFNALDRLALVHSGKRITVLLDFHNQTLFSSKALHYLLFEAMQKQNTDFTVVAINLNADESHWRDAFSAQRNTHRGIKPIAVFNESFGVRFYGTTSREAGMLETLLDGTKVQDADIQSLAKAYDHYFTFSVKENRYEFIHPPARIIEHVREAIKTQLAEILASPSSGIFQEDAQVLIPSRHYCKGYFEIYKLLAEEGWRSAMREWCKYWLLLLQPDYVISLTEHMSTALEWAIKDVAFSPTGVPIQHIKIKTPIQEVTLLRLTLNIARDKKGVIFSEVVGTTNTLKFVLQHVQHTTVLKILAAVNAVEDDGDIIEFKGRTYEIESLLRNRLNYFKSLPPGWLYRDVRLVDPSTHVLIKEEPRTDDSLWISKGIKQDDVQLRGEEVEVLRNEFLESCVVPTHSYFEGHFTMGDTHLIYLFNIPSLNRNYLDEIVSLIQTDTNQHLAKSTTHSQISHILYLAFNPGMDMIANSLNRCYPDAKLMAIGINEFNSSYDQEYISGDLQAVILVDDAFISGDSLIRAYDIAERRGARLIFVYVVIKRGSEYQARRLMKLTRYGHAEIQFRYLTDVEMPVYMTQNCPICLRSAELVGIRDKLPDNKLIGNYVDEETVRLAYVPVKIVFKEGKFKSADTHGDEKLRLRWKLELAKRKPGLRKELATVIRGYKNSPNDNSCLSQVVYLFQILAREKYTFLLDERIRKDIFYDTFAQDIADVSRRIVEDVGDLSVESLDAVLTVLTAFDEEYFITKLFDIYERTASSPEKLIRVIVHTLQSRKAHEYPGMIANVMRRLGAGEMGDLTGVVDDLWAYWRNEEQKLAERRHQKLERFKELMGGVLHEIGHLRDNVETAVTMAPISYERVTSSWLTFYEHVMRVIPLIRSCAGSNVTSELQEKLTAKIAALEFQFRLGNELTQPPSSNSNMLANEAITQVATQLEQIVVRIYELIYRDTDNIVSLLENFKTNAKTVAFRIIHQQRKDLQSRGIRVQRDFPEGACLVFGEEVFVGQIFQNLIENVWKYSEGDLLRIEAKIHESGAYVDIVFLDNGKGMSEDKEIGDGLGIVGRNVKYYDGDFQISNLPVDDEDYSKGFRTKAVVTLPFFKERSNDD
jgi:signal transduction histidine kinase